jgi:hypothetical protein
MCKDIRYEGFCKRNKLSGKDYFEIDKVSKISHWNNLRGLRIKNRGKNDSFFICIIQYGKFIDIDQTYTFDNGIC